MDVLALLQPSCMADYPLSFLSCVYVFCRVSGTVGAKFAVYMHCAGTTKKVIVRDGDKDLLAEVYIAMFYLNEGLEVPSGVEPSTIELFLKDKRHGVYYENFLANHVEEGAEVAIKDPSKKDIPVASFQGEALAVLFGVTAENALARATEVLLTGSGTGAESGDSKAHGASGGDAGGDAGGAQDGGVDFDGGGGGQGEAEKPNELASDAMKKSVRKLEVKLQDPTLKQRVWRLLDDPTSSTAATGITLFVLGLIMLSTITFCLETLPFFYSDETEFSSEWFVMEAVCITFFTVEIIARMVTCPSLSAYIKETMNIIDIVAVLPFYLELAFSGVDIPGLSVLRVIRLVRVFRLLKVSKGSITVFAITMKRSARPLYMLVFFTLIAMVVFGSLVYFMERGVYDEDVKQWMRTVGYHCNITIERDMLSAADGSWTLDQAAIDAGEAPPPALRESSCAFVQTLRGAESAEAPFSAMYSCDFTWKRNSGCTAIKEVTPFESIPASFWWALVTMTTVGYGDMWPIYWYGKVLGMIIMLSGILVIALPITVIGANFAETYKEELVKSDNKVKQ